MEFAKFFLSGLAYAVARKDAGTGSYPPPAVFWTEKYIGMWQFWSLFQSIRKRSPVFLNWQKDLIFHATQLQDGFNFIRKFFRIDRNGKGFEARYQL